MPINEWLPPGSQSFLQRSNRTKDSQGFSDAAAKEVVLGIASGPRDCADPHHHGYRFFMSRGQVADFKANSSC
jgi:hypothetical protein